MLNYNDLQDILLTSKVLKVLYIEDDKDARESILMMLDGFFDYIEIASNGSEGLKLYQNYFDITNSYFDIVISDINMPILDGIGMTKAIYKINKKQKIIILSSHSEKEYLIPLLNMGIESFVQKPISLEKLTDIIKNICEVFKNDSSMVLGDGYIYNRCSNLLFLDEQTIELHGNEIKLLELFLDNIHRNFTLIDIYNHIHFDKPYKDFSEDSIRGLLKRLRKKLPTNLIINNRTLGYKITLPNSNK